MRLIALLPALALALALTACDKQSRKAEVADAPAAAPPAAAAPAAPAGPLVALDDEGLRLVSPGGGTVLVAFNRSIDDSTAALSEALGAPKSRSINEECGAGPIHFVTWGDSLQVLSQNGKFVGWSLDAPGLMTMDGVGVGSTRAQLLAARPSMEVQESTLGTEFLAGDIGGLFDGKGPNAKITTLWAGTTCMFR